MKPASGIPRAARLARVLDVVFAVVSLIALWPVITLISVAIVLESGPPVFYRQIRIGRGGRHFAMLKFRKFGPRVGDDGSPLTLENDPRMTRVGRFLAATKLDELPQLFNILRGDMSVVGPRPESLAFEDCFEGRAVQLLAFRPGIFGPTQVRFRHESRYYPSDGDPIRFYRQTLFPAKAALDLGYYPRRTIGSDVAWIFRGILAVVDLGSGAGGHGDPDARGTGSGAFGAPALLPVSQDKGVRP